MIQLGSQENALVFGDENDRSHRQGFKIMIFNIALPVFSMKWRINSKFEIELIKVEDIVDGNNEWSLDLLAYIFTSISLPGLRARPRLNRQRNQTPI